jgi:NADH:ubiquinone oxidoreductase subunit K
VIPVAYELILSASLFAIGLYGIMVRKNAIVVLMSIEIILNAAVLNFVAFSAYAQPNGDPSGQVFALLAIAIAAGEAAVGLAIFLALYQTHGTVELDKIRLLRW